MLNLYKFISYSSKFVLTLLQKMYKHYETLFGSSAIDGIYAKLHRKFRVGTDVTPGLTSGLSWIECNSAVNRL